MGSTVMHVPGTLEYVVDHPFFLPPTCCPQKCGSPKMWLILACLNKSTPFNNASPINNAITHQQRHTRNTHQQRITHQQRHSCNTWMAPPRKSLSSAAVGTCLNLKCALFDN
eukprot:m.197607 g.197607  ORF g.197607 m.197607 type:complete len:112 (-) comp32663_c1_seq2:879-1214(-)